MTRAQLLWLQAWIALTGAVFWLLPPHLPHASYATLVSFLWFGLALASIYLEALEDWAHRVSSFLGFLFFTVEGMLGLLGVGGKPGILLVAFFHGCTFVLAVAGKYLSRDRRHRGSLDRMAEQAMAELRRELDE